MRTRLTVAAIAVGALLLAVPAAALTDWNTGDLFLGVNGGDYQVYSNDGALKETISNTTGGFTTGCAFNPALDRLYTTDFSGGMVVVYDNADPHAVVQTIPTRTPPESIVFAGTGNFFVGGPGGGGVLEEYDAAGTLVDSDVVAADFTGGPDWIDLAADQMTMYYTSESRTVRRYDVVNDVQLADFATLPGSGNAFALRLLAPGDGTGGLLVADQGDVKRLDASGAVIQTYDITGVDGWFSLNLDPDGTSFWAGSFNSGTAHRFDIASGGIDNALDTIDTGVGSGSLFGICLKGEPTAAVPTIAVTGKGRFNDEGDGQVKFTLDNESFTMDRPRGLKIDFDGEVEAVSGADTQATLSGTGTWNGEAGYSFQVDVVDNGSPGVYIDTITVEVRDAAGAVIFSRGPETLKGGDITVASAE